MAAKGKKRITAKHETFNATHGLYNEWLLRGLQEKHYS